MPKHKHYDVIVAWANGEEIEWSKDGEIWSPAWPGTRPSWFEDYFYRVKPKIPMYRLYSNKGAINAVYVVLKDFSDYETKNLKYLEEKDIIWRTDWLPLPERKEECLMK